VAQLHLRRREPDGQGRESHHPGRHLVTVTRVGSLDEALAEANAPAYGLTAGIFSEDGSEVDRFLDEIHAGVVYVNRRAGATTGAWPGTQTFCGWKSSGSTGKGGLGPYYLAQFMREQSRTVVREATQ
jgi:1-pyrroline-5-carboxylate dehydrogenase